MATVWIIVNRVSLIFGLSIRGRPAGRPYQDLASFATDASYLNICVFSETFGMIPTIRSSGRQPIPPVGSRLCRRRQSCPKLGWAV